MLPHAVTGNRISEMSDLTGHTSLVELNLRRNALTTLTTTSAPPAAATVPASAVTGPCVSISQPSAVQGVQTGGTATAGPTAAVECRSALPGGVHRLVLSHNRFRSLAALEPLSSLTSLTELQVEGCPLARAMGPPAFRAGVLSLCAQAQQLEVLDMQQVGASAR
jgi:Leucine-rich repeat (LRR) protein